MKKSLKQLSLAISLALTAPLDLLAESATSATLAESGRGFSKQKGYASIDKNDHYNFQIRPYGYYGSQGQSAGGVDALLPLWQSQAAILFFDTRLTKEEGSAATGSLGLGYRHLFNDQYLLGGYAFYDRQQSLQNDLFQQLTLGLEFKTEEWSWVTNAYLPLGSTLQGEVDTGTYQLVPIGNSTGLYHLSFDYLAEKALYGGDTELGYTIPHTEGLSLFLRGFYYDNSQVDALAGAAFRAEYALSGTEGKSLWSLLNDLTFFAEISYDEVGGSRWLAGTRLTLGPDYQSARPVMEKRLTDYVRRNNAVITAIAEGSGKNILRHANGNPVNFAKVDNYSDLLNAGANRNADVIIMQGDLVNPGTEGLSLSENQYLTGGGYDFIYQGRLYNARFSSGASLRSEAGTVISAANNNTLRDFTMYGSGAAGQWGLSSQGSLNLNNVSFADFSGEGAQALHLIGGQLTIGSASFINNNIGIYFDNSNTGNNLSLNADNLTFNANNTGMLVNANSGTVIFNIDHFYSVNDQAPLIFAASGQSVASFYQTGSGNLVGYHFNQAGAALSFSASDNAILNLSLAGLNLDGSQSGGSIGLAQDGLQITGNGNAQLNVNLNGIVAQYHRASGANLTLNDNSQMNLLANRLTFSNNKINGLMLTAYDASQVTNFTMNDSLFDANGDGIESTYSTWNAGLKFAVYDQAQLTATINRSTFSHSWNGLSVYTLSRAGITADPHIHLTMNDASIVNNDPADQSQNTNIAGLALITSVGNIEANLNNVLIQGNQAGVLVGIGGGDIAVTMNNSSVDQAGTHALVVTGYIGGENSTGSLIVNNPKKLAGILTTMSVGDVGNRSIVVNANPPYQMQASDFQPGQSVDADCSDNQCTFTPT